MSKNSFKQNKYIKKNLRFYVKKIIKDISTFFDIQNLLSSDGYGANYSYFEGVQINSVVCVGGESYLFGITSDYINRIIHYTNSKYIYNDLEINNKVYKKNILNNIVDYNKYTSIVSGDILIINLAKLNINLLNVINKRFYKNIIIINCHHNEFWKRINILTNYKLINRKQFIKADVSTGLTSKNFITVNTFIYKYEIPEFISLGTSCAVAYQLKKLGLKNNKYPFDWSKSNIDKINLVLSNKFNEYDIVKVNKLSENHKYIDSSTEEFQEHTNSYIVSNKYNITFAHELFSLSENDINKFQNELINRINTFTNASNSKSKKNNFVIFILFDMNNTKNINIKLELLINNLKIYFNNFKLLYITNNIKSNISLDNLKIIYIDEQYLDYLYSNYNWFELIYSNVQ
jgi:hypothetical protein